MGSFLLVFNITNSPVKLYAQMLKGQVNPATPVSSSDLVGGIQSKMLVEKVYPPFTLSWMERESLIPKSDFDVECAKSA